MNRRCPSCAGAEAELLHRLELVAPDGHPLQGGYDVVACAGCGTGFADVAIGPAEQAYYASYYGELARYAMEATLDADGGNDQVPAWMLARFSALADQIAALVPDRSARILDVGCANGTLLAALADRGYHRLQGIDPSPLSASFAATKGIRVDVGTFDAMPAEVGRFDCVCLTGVLEHLWDVDGAMRTLTGLLEPGGVIYIAVPDASRYLDPYIAPFQDFSVEHVNHFSPATLAVLGARFSLRTVWSGPSDADLVPGSPCAAISVGWRLDGSVGLPAVVRDQDLVGELRAFTDRSKRDFQLIDAGLERSLRGADRVAVWGFGELTMKLLALPSLASRRLTAVVDGNPSRRGMRVKGLPVGDPADLPDDGTPVVIGSLLSGPAIEAELRRRDRSNPTVKPVAA